MSEDREIYGDMSIDDEDQLQPGDTLDDGDLEDVLDRGYSPPDRAPKGYDDYPTEAERRQGESLDEKLAEEEPDIDPYAEVDEVEDHEDENALDEQLGLDEADERTGRLVAPDGGVGEDVDKQEVALDVGIDGAGASAEEAAMHITREPEPPEGDEL
ncbi:DUF5709 domain-containing protein [Nocardioides ganghwensis]|jgi:hypothetical protein|uniref:DUF5709 domain-containing protein n=1 Tax=Nocardioides ganghwensis TaxID=252230 RepID=A0A4Q2SAL0_9ACTN|nr:DUF5709 domain-containing protein [Nocardioides ganghwensis]MBD3947755.1 hypothetical protein [Nocardioides ganghwensis]RYB98084.1 hypothetical protein EUA07_18565 [Nocardioides ganghwensis]